jgi:predicted dehydrogenase
MAKSRLSQPATMTKSIRVGLIGLSSNKEAQFAGAWGKNAHFPFLTKSDQYVITALCNSSLESAKKAIQVHGLDAGKVQTYGDPTSLANDPNVDLVVCSVNVKEHYNLIKPAVSAGKMVFCEWPLASNLTQMKELVDLAEQTKSKTFVGLQGRNGVYNNVIRSFIGDREGQFGEVLSTQMTAYGTIHGMANLKEMAYLMDIKTGGNIFTISAIHRECSSGLESWKSYPLTHSIQQYLTP